MNKDIQLRYDEFRKKVEEFNLKLKKEEQYIKIKQRRKERYDTDILFKLSTCIRSNILMSFKNNGYKKESKTEQILGCTFEEFKQHIEQQFEPWMTWNNYGKYNGKPKYGWYIDHIIPVSSGTSIEDILFINRYTNLRPLCSYINRCIKRNRLDLY